jgi:glycosyltransferase involved in cell wall biosynthesis
MGRYLRGLIAGREQELLGFCAAGDHDEQLRLTAQGLRAWPLWEQISLPRLIARHKIEAFIAPYNTAPMRMPARTRLVLIVHDLIYFEPLPRSQSRYQNLGRAYRRWVVPHAIRRADVIVVNSHHTADQVHARFGISRKKLRVVPPCVDERWFTNGGGTASQCQYVLAVAGEAPSKNLERALEAFAAYRADGGKLRMKVAGVKTAFHGQFAAKAAALGAGEAVHFAPYVSEAKMMSLYRNAAALLMSSLNEGFGLPVAEAMASGVPIVCSRTGSLPEVAGDAAEYFDPYSVDAMASALKRVLGDDVKRACMREAGFRQVRRYHPAAVRPLIETLWDVIGPLPQSP